MRECAAAFLATGVPAQRPDQQRRRRRPARAHRDGFELTFGVNHLGHFLLTTLLLDKLKASAPGAHRQRVEHGATTRRRDRLGGGPPADQDITALPEYAVSKLANVLFTQELARRLDGTGVTDLRAAPGRDRVRHLGAACPVRAARSRR